MNYFWVCRSGKWVIVQRDRDGRYRYFDNPTSHPRDSFDTTGPVIEQYESPVELTAVTVGGVPARRCPDCDNNPECPACKGVKLVPVDSKWLRRLEPREQKRM